MENQIITMEGNYKYFDGEVARILCVDSPDSNFPVVSVDPQGRITKHDKYGSSMALKRPNADDLIPDVPLWEGEIWVHEYLHTVIDGDIEYTELISQGYRKIKVREVE